MNFKHFENLYSKQLHFRLFRLEKQEFKEILKMWRIDWCALMLGKKNGNFVIGYILRMVKEISPQFVQECPYKVGKYSIFNGGVSRRMVMSFPKITIKAMGAFYVDKILIANWSAVIETIE